jgi:rhomboid family GlyGly-CTERM serine protease
MQILRRIAHWQVPVVIALLSIVMAVFGDDGREILRFDQPAIAGGEYWRLLSGHFAHLGNHHMWLNLAGLLLVWLLVGRQYSTRQWYAVAAISIVVMDAGFWVLDSDMSWYVGLSGLLNGLLIGGAIRGMRAVPVESIVICSLVFAKILYEQFYGPLPGSESVSGGTVIVNAHLYGAVGGGLAAFFFWHRAGRPASI